MTRSSLKLPSAACAGLALLLTAAAPLAADGPARRTHRVELTAERQKTLRAAPSEVREALVIRRGFVTAARGFTLYEDAYGLIFIVRAELQQPSVNPRPVKGGDRVFVQPPDGSSNSGWMMIACECDGRTDEDCTLVKDTSGNLILDENQEVQCEGDNCCEVKIFGVNGAGTTVHITGGVSM